MEDESKSCSRGALVVLEGLDRCGKTSQSSRLVKNLDELGYPAELFRFPDRNTVIGQMISSYLNSDSQLDDRTIHLLFSANRWEKRCVPVRLPVLFLIFLYITLIDRNHMLVNIYC